MDYLAKKVAFYRHPLVVYQLMAYSNVNEEWRQMKTFLFEKGYSQEDAMKKIAPFLIEFMKDHPDHTLDDGIEIRIMKEDSIHFIE